MTVPPIYQHSRALLGLGRRPTPPVSVTPPLHQARLTSRKFDIFYVSGPVVILMIPHNRTFVMLISKLTFYFNFKVGPWGGRSLN